LTEGFLAVFLGAAFFPDFLATFLGAAFLPALRATLGALGAATFFAAARAKEKGLVSD
jgi:hypothetical protein